jgi:5-keto 4-deoxyuronate isomerase
MFQTKMKMKRTQKKIKKGGICRFPTQKLIEANEIQKSIQHEVHGASSTTLKNSGVSNTIILNIHTRRSDAFFHFARVLVLVRQADLLPTPVSSQPWFTD